MARLRKITKTNGPRTNRKMTEPKPGLGIVPAVPPSDVKGRSAFIPAFGVGFGTSHPASQVRDGGRFNRPAIGR
jgi:hypothetical protein